MDNKGYNKFQYSYFLDNGAQVVIRGDEWDDFNADVVTAIGNYPTRGELPTRQVESPAAKIANMARAKETPTGECSICHEKAWINEGVKNGKPWKNMKCSKTPAHIIWWDFSLNGWRG